MPRRQLPNAPKQGASLAAKQATEVPGATVLEVGIGRARLCRDSDI